VPGSTPLVGQGQASSQAVPVSRPSSVHSLEVFTGKDKKY